MIWKTILVTCLVAGALAEYQITEDQKQKFRDIVTDQCKKNGAEDKVDQVEGAVKDVVECVKGLFNFETVKQEIEDAKPNGALDEVFVKYCNKSPQLKTCLHTLLQSVSPCLKQELREQVHVINNATDQLIDFVCFKDGDRIALFIAEGGPECFQEKTEAIRECGEKLKSGLTSVEEASKLKLEDQCKKFDDFSTCVVKALETCSKSTPSNMAESLFKFVRKGSPCK